MMSARCPHKSYRAAGRLFSSLLIHPLEITISLELATLRIVEAVDLSSGQDCPSLADLTLEGFCFPSPCRGLRDWNFASCLFLHISQVFFLLPLQMYNFFLLFLSLEQSVSYLILTSFILHHTETACHFPRSPQSTILVTDSLLVRVYLWSYSATTNK